MQKQTKEQMLELIKAARSPEVKLVLTHLLDNLAPMTMHNQPEQVFKGYMMALFDIKELQEKEV